MKNRLGNKNRGESFLLKVQTENEGKVKNIGEGIFVKGADLKNRREQKIEGNFDKGVNCPVKIKGEVKSRREVKNRGLEKF